MTNPAVRAVDLGKRYRIGSEGPRYRTAREAVRNAVVAPIRRARKLLRGQATGAADLDDEIWALRNVSFEVEPGEVVGIIGRNGAGKSTLLKLLSRITLPTEGFADIRGRVGSLLEVGTGFHPELTGRENVYLNGSILGMSRQEIDRKFDEIAAFSGVEKFLATPVKHYSSGMSVRLAFAVAAHLDPEILVIDEVLSVGDARFQRKCLQKMEEVRQGGRTVLFVSHNMPAVTRLCERTILLDDGHVIADGPSDQIVNQYLSSGLGTTAERRWTEPAKAPGDGVARLRRVTVGTRQGQVADAIDIRRPVVLEMEYEVLSAGCVLLPHYLVFNSSGVHVLDALDLDPEWRGRERPRGTFISAATIPGNLLAEGTHLVHACLAVLDPFRPVFTAKDAVAFQVVDSMTGDTARGEWGGNMSGAVRPLLQWRTTYRPPATLESVRIKSESA